VTWTKQNAIPYWYFGKVNDRYYSITYNAYWYSTDPQYEENPWGYGNEPFWTVSAPGYYAAMMQIIWWYDDGTVATVTGQPAAYSLIAGGQWSDRAAYCPMS
jgi:hypothetical protein